MDASAVNDVFNIGAKKFGTIRQDFQAVLDKAGFGKHTGWTLDIGHGDFDNDGDQDVYLACDYGTDRIFFNNGNGTFTDATEKSIGFDTRKGMNAEVTDYDNDGWLDIYATAGYISRDRNKPDG